MVVVWGSFLMGNMDMSAIHYSSALLNWVAPQVGQTPLKRSSASRVNTFKTIRFSLLNESSIS